MQPGSEAESEEVSLEFSGSVLWDSPIEADFVADAGLKKSPPSGSRHPSNAVNDSQGTTQPQASTSQHGELTLVDGEKVNMRCILKAKDPSATTRVSVRKVWFEDPTLDVDQSPCILRAIPDPRYSTTKTLFESKDHDPARTLGNGTKFGVVYRVEATMKDSYRQESASTTLGVVCVDWVPIPIHIQDDARSDMTNCGLHVKTHGPLELQSIATSRFRGPPCYIESSPFVTSCSVGVGSATMGVPFDLVIDIENKTALHQLLKINVGDKSGEKGRSASPSVLLSGVVGNQMRLAPFEKQSASFTAIALKSGKVVLPAISVSSERYKSWVINDSKSNRSIFVTP